MRDDENKKGVRRKGCDRRRWMNVVEELKGGEEKNRHGQREKRARASLLT